MTNTEYIKFLLLKIDTDENIVKEFCESVCRIDNFNDELAEIDRILKETKDIEQTLSLRENMAEKSGINIYAINIAVIILATRWLFEEYKNRGYSDDLFWDTVTDIKWKIIECKNVKGVYGTFVEGWYNGFFRMDIFALGRFQFERSAYNEENSVTVDGHTIKKGDKIWYVHIPSSGPMPKEAREDSYRRAAEFFKDEYGKVMVIKCSSWLMYEENKKIFPNHLNMVDFMNDFTITDSFSVEGYNDCWRLFGHEFNGNYEDLVADNTPRRAMKDWLLNGGKAGKGIGYKIIK